MKKKQDEKIINYDDQSDVLYIGLRKGVEEEFVEVAPGIGVEMNTQGQVIGIEILNASKVLRPVAQPLRKHTLAQAA